MDTSTAICTRRVRRIRRQQVILGAALAGLLSGCVQIGPQALAAGRPMYNIAVQQTEAQQLLLNIVRQRYNDPLMFLDVTSISSGFSTQAAFGLSGAIIAAGKNNLDSSLAATAGETPFIFYAPNTGEKFVRQMLTPLELGTVALILQAGWSIERVLLIIGESINQYRNSAGGGTQGERYRKLRELLSAMRELQRDGRLIVGAQSKAGDNAAKPDLDASTPETRLALVFLPEAVDTPEYRFICETIAAPCDGQPLRLQQAFGGTGEAGTVALATRSLFSTLYFLAQGVEVPEADALAGNAVRFATAPGGPFDGAGSDDVLFRVHASAAEPDGASVKVFYRDAWFYIADNDADSKVTFALLSMLLTLQAGNTEKVSPMLTLPVN